MPKESAAQLKKEVARLKRVASKQEKELVEAKLLTDYDSLTGLYNRRGFIQESEKFIREMANEKNFKKRRFKIENFSIIFVDLDNLKKVNDLYGHKFGDKFIKMSAYILKGCLRDLDIVARWGGDEFVIGLINIADEEAHDIAEKLNRKISLIEIPNVNVRFSASFGVISAKNKYQQRILNLYELIEKADLAMYEIKQKKKRGIVAHYIEKFMSRKHKLDHGTHVTIKKINLDGIVHQNNHPPK